MNAADMREWVKAATPVAAMLVAAAAAWFALTSKVDAIDRRVVTVEQYVDRDRELALQMLQDLREIKTDLRALRAELRRNADHP